MKAKTNKHVLTIIRNIKALTMLELANKSGRMIHSISHYENRRVTPYPKTIKSIADILNIKPDILFYSFGMLPEDEMNKIKSDPFFYMEKIRKLCNNHSARYGNRDVDYDGLNRVRAFDYITKESLDDTDL